MTGEIAPEGGPPHHIPLGQPPGFSDDLRLTDETVDIRIEPAIPNERNHLQPQVNPQGDSNPHGQR